MDLKKAKERLDKAEKEKTRLEEQMRFLEERKSEMENELTGMGLTVESIDDEILKMQKEIEDAMAKLDTLDVPAEEEVDLESLGL